MTTVTGTKYRADHVGSLLRPPEVLEAHAAFGQKRISHEQLTEVEDRAILAALDLQKQVGLDIYSDGEYRRGNWAGDFISSVDGYVSAEVPIRFEWRLPEELSQRGEGPVREALAAMPQQAGMVVGNKLRQKQRLTGHEVPFLKEHAPGAFKVTLPAASYIVGRGWKPGITEQAYPTRWDLMQEVVRILKAEVEALQAEGVPYIQIDNPHWPDYIPEDRRAAWKSIGVDPEQAMDEDVRGDNMVVAGLDRSRVTLATHICRGNGRSAWHTVGGYEPIASKVFGQLEADRFLLEYDSDRSGGFEPLRHMPRGRHVVLGLVTTKVGELESSDDLRRRIDEAAKYVPLENLSLSPQCGFASIEQGNLLSWDEQKRKLELVVETARKVWG
ncbi:MAG TPA: cobalamin-independent methionine synthase II family protein [Chloroflexota bacterium]|jgi:5-methyltetrahydropteroyltriglutamate--homocysteine methyltransferase